MEHEQKRFFGIQQHSTPGLTNLPESVLSFSPEYPSDQISDFTKRLKPINLKMAFTWSPPKIAWFGVSHYAEQPPKPKHLSKYGRFERPQLLIQHNKPTHLFFASQGGKYMTSSPFVFRVS